MRPLVHFHSTLAHAAAAPLRTTLIPTLSLVPAAAAADNWFVYSVLSVAATVGYRVGLTSLGRTLNGPICAMAITFVAAGSGLLPPASPQVLEAQALAVRLATPMLLLRADLRAVARKAGRLLPAFLLGTVGSLAGTLCAVMLLHDPLTAALGVDGLKVAWALAAKNIGGGLNFVAVAAALGISPGPVAAALAVDNVMALVYFPMCAWLGRNQADPAASPDPPPAGKPEPQDGEPVRTETRIADQSACLAVAFSVVTFSRHFASTGYDVPLATLITVALATLAPRAAAALAPIGDELGTLILYLFFATAGWSGGALRKLVTGGPVLLALLSVIYAVHLLIVLGLGVALRRGGSNRRRSQLFSTPQLLVASNANIGGPATATALAVGNNWPSLVTPSLLVGNLGYAVATPLCLLLHSCFG